MSGWTLAFFASLTLLMGLFSLSGFLLGAGLAIVAYIELSGWRKLKLLDPAATRRLGFNQIALGVILLVYAGWGIAQALLGQSPYEAQLAGGGPVADAIRPIDSLHRALTVGFYALVMVFAVIAQGCLSAYYFTRGRHLRRFLASTEPWIVDMLRVART